MKYDERKKTHFFLFPIRETRNKLRRIFRRKSFLNKNRNNNNKSLLDGKQFIMRKELDILRVYSVFDACV